MSSNTLPSTGRPASAGADLSQLQRLPFAAAARARSLPLDAYAGLLRCLAIVYEALERAVDGQADGALASLWSGEARRLHLLHNDLDACGGRTLAAMPMAELRAELLAERIRLWGEYSPSSLLGVAAVFGGSAVALAAPAKSIARCYGFKGGAGTSFVARAEQAGASAMPATDEATVHATTTLQAIVAALHPADTRPLSQLARVINPQAGNYAIPDDLREIRAALRAGARTWQAIPYYGLRYADRGREWTWSDSCWLATLAKLEQKAVDAQIAWVGRLLGTRGMPQLLLEEHLYALADELSAARPAERGRYARLSVAAGKLAEQRRAHIADDDMAAIAGAFDGLDLGIPPDARLGWVLVAAVADEAAGVPQAVESVLRWFVDAQRFPQALADAAQATIAAARAATRK